MRELKNISKGWGKFQKVAEPFRGFEEYLRGFYKTERGLNTSEGRGRGQRKFGGVERGQKKVGGAILEGVVREDSSEIKQKPHEIPDHLDKDFAD